VRRDGEGAAVVEAGILLDRLQVGQELGVGEVEVVGDDAVQHGELKACGKASSSGALEEVHDGLDGVDLVVEARYR